MGITWIITDGNYFLELGKKGEWAGEMWKVWSFFLEADSHIEFVSDISDRYERVKESTENYNDTLTLKDQLYILNELHLGLRCLTHLMLKKIAVETQIKILNDYF